MADRNRGQPAEHPNRIYNLVRIRRSKNYAYRLITIQGEKTLRKIRGITLNYHASKLMNYEVIKAMILGQGESVAYVHTEHNIKRKKKAGGVLDLVTQPDKRYRISFSN